jgi:cyclophilin family peptidyl-prolyl cis-trans isomerase
MPDASGLGPLERCYTSSTGDGAPEIRFNVLRNAGKIGGDAAAALVTRGLLDERPFVRRVAREELAKLGREVPDLPEPRREPVALDLPSYGENPWVEIETTKGTLLFELFPGEAPVHVHNLLELARRGHYDGTPFHRVVPDFVIQGGDYRGDGNGGGTWRGREDSLRHEIGPRKYVRGSLGMPRNDDPDSGGSQIFVTHRPTPHLDGRYTILGELREGFDVLDAVEVGDRILAVRRAR